MAMFMARTGPSRFGTRDMFAVGGETIADDLGKDICSAFPGRFIAFDDHRGRASAGHQPVTVAVKRP